MTLTALDDGEGTIFGRAVDGRYSAELPDEPSVIGYGPTLRHARVNLAMRLSETRAGRRIGAVLTVRRVRGRLWTARLDDDLAIVGEGWTMTEAERALIDRLPKERPTQIARLVSLEEHEDGSWSARASDDRNLIGLIGWGTTANEAEADLLGEEERSSAPKRARL
jgi:hypothetical protein